MKDFNITNYYRPSSLLLSKNLVGLACVIALLLAPFQATLAEDFNGPLDSWDLIHGVDALNFDIEVKSQDPFRNYFLPLCVSIDNVKSLYSLLARKPKQLSIQGLVIQDMAEPTAEIMHYNFEINTQGGMRLNLQHRF